MKIRLILIGVVVCYFFVFIEVDKSQGFLKKLFFLFMSLILFLVFLYIGIRIFKNKSGLNNTVFVIIYFRVVSQFQSWINL